MVQFNILSGRKAGAQSAARRFPFRIGRAAGNELQLEVGEVGVVENQEVRRVVAVGHGEVRWQERGRRQVAAVSGIPQELGEPLGRPGSVLLISPGHQTDDLYDKRH